MAVLCSAAFFYLGVPRLINASHDGNIPILSSIVSSDFYPLEKYHSHWGKIQLRFTALACLVVVCLAVFAQRSARDWLDGKYLVPSNQFNMSAVKRMLASLVIAAVVMGQVGCIVFDKEFWPFSNYFMFGGLQGPVYENVRVFGVLESGEEIYLSDRFKPYTPGRLEIELKKSGVEQAELTPRVEKELHALARWYEKNRKSGKESGPPINEIRVYLHSYDLDPELGNIMKPNRRKVLHTIQLEGKD